ncbi:nucleic-acid-binding protein from transposon X-element [Caerostris darwini]|uniref:Nucleic-acid-binding protein from transposon X-element n=1 Tax=Caerostris darwini TaxID=1538125 RepID=A0AAV4W8M4_9ARAC|nr:nucleic-acid-binding protein from transposon X-element [Caerostris darwini]
MNCEEGLEFSVDQATGLLKGQDGEPYYSVKADIPEGMCVSKEERQAKEICQNITDLEYEIAALEAHLQYNSTIKSNQDKFLKNPNNYPHYGQLCAEIQFIQKSLEDRRAKLINISDDGFKTPGKKQFAKATEKHYPFRIPVNNKFANIEEETTSNTQAKETDDYSPNKPPPIMLALTANYTHALQEIHRKFPKTENKLTKGYIKIFPDTEDSYRKIITYVINAKYEYYIRRPRNERPLKIVVKGLPIDTNIDEIKHQFEDLKFSLNKIAQLKIFKIKEPLLIFLVELNRTLNVK